MKVLTLSFFLSLISLSTFAGSRVNGRFEGECQTKLPPEPRERDGVLYPVKSTTMSRRLEVSLKGEPTLNGKLSNLLPSYRYDLKISSYEDENCHSLFKQTFLRTDLTIEKSGDNFSLEAWHQAVSSVVCWNDSEKGQKRFKMMGGEIVSPPRESELLNCRKFSSALANFAPSSSSNSFILSGDFETLSWGKTDQRGNCIGSKYVNRAKQNKNHNDYEISIQERKVVEYKTYTSNSTEFCNSLIRIQ